MIRRSFRIGLTLGLLGGLAFALAKMLGGRPDSEADGAPAGSDPWPLLAEDLVSPAPPVASAAPAAERFAQPEPTPQPEPVAQPVDAIEQPARAATTPTTATAPKTANADRADRAAKKTAKTAKKTAKKAAKATAKAPAKTSAKKTATGTGAKPAKKAAPRKKAIGAAWVEPNGDVCPTSHPVKAKLASKIFHLPGMLNYARTKPDRCYRDAAAAESDDLRPAKR